MAVLAGSRVTMPYAMAVLSNTMIDECFQNHPKTLGEIVLRAKRRSVEAAPPIELTGRYQTRIEFFSTKKRRFLNSCAWASRVVVTPVIAGVEAPSTEVHADRKSVV
mgnify:CR=1 FL=1